MRSGAFFSLGPWPTAGVCVAAVAAVGLVDALTGFALAFSILYLGPATLATWRVGRAMGLAISILSVLSWSLADMYGAHAAASWVVWWNASLRLCVLLVLCLSLDAVRRALDSARTDHLTQLPNSRSFEAAAGREIDRARRYRRPFTIAYLDVDGFKEVNDRQGHTSGDDLLRLIAGTLRASVRRTDVAARLGGDEFAILLPETDVDPGKQVAKKVHEALSASVAASRWHVTFSMGVVTFTRPPRAVEHALHVADTVMYNVKHQGRNRILYMTSTGEAA